MARKGRFNIQITTSGEKAEATKTKLVNALRKMRDEGDIESAQGTLTYEEIPETITI